MNNQIEHGWKYWAILAVVVFVAVSLGNNKNEFNSTNTIAVQGTGEVYAIQDTVMLSFSVTKTARDVKVAQKDVDDVVSQIVKAVKDLGVEDKNIKTVSYSVYPHYVNEASPCPYGAYCPSVSKADGFDASQTVEIKMHDLDKSGELISEIGRFNPTNLSGLQFVIEDDKAVLREARQKAIADAKMKAKQLSKDLGVRLGKIVSFDEGGRGYPMPVYMKAEALGMGGADSSSVSSLPTGQNKIISNVTVVYEIR